MFQAEVVIGLARLYQKHGCTKYCSEDAEAGEVCRKRFPRVLSLYDHLCLRPRMASSKDREWFCTVKDFRGMLKDKMVLVINTRKQDAGEDDARFLLSLLAEIADPPVPEEGGGFFYGGVQIPDCAWLQHHMEKCRAFTHDEAEVLQLGCYHYLTGVARVSRVVPRRSWQEVRVPGYNPTLLAATMANGEVDLILHSPGVVEHYVTKGSKGRDALTLDAMELDKRGGRADKHAAARLRREADCGRRETTLTEAMFCGLDRRLHPVKQVGLLDPVLVSTHCSGNVPAFTVLKERYARREAQLEGCSLVQYAIFFDQHHTHYAARNTDAQPVPIVSADPDGHPSHLPQASLTHDGHTLPLLKRPRPANLTREDDYGLVVAYRVCSIHFDL